MFTGLIQDIGTLKQIQTRGNYRVLSIDSVVAGDDLRIGESISCDGACLTVTEFDKSSFKVEASQETITKTIIGGYRSGAAINLERALKANDRLGGHIVSGHVDETGNVDYVKNVGDSIEVAVTYSGRYDDLVIDKGSVAINGVSLTINQSKSGWLTVNVIPHTAGMTTLGRMRKGERVNIEFDMLGKYVAKMFYKGNPNGLTVKKLKESGW